MKKTIRTGLIVTGIALLPMIMIALVAPSYFVDGASVPVHWGMSGEPDRFADAGEAARYLWLMPATLILIAALMVVAPLLEPFRENLVQSRKAYLATWLGVVLLLVGVQAAIASGMTGYLAEGPNMVRFILGITSILFIVIGNYLPKTRQSFFLGLRTPWTLTSASTWEKTHKLAGKLFLLIGVAGLIGTFTLKSGMVFTLFLPVTVMIAALVSTIYSYVVWRGADDKTTSPEYLV